eukprot:TRINITY_DN38915_c0_g1_i1.p1 TRINITY_DN38915_c0_g1~~TRINITY_DN38915_c0_g1_i1.p1  ORF type:complete len:510 (+),score=52.55 TRINITY_DN38915_c0_g1_i1:464-1993(+)
MSIEVWKSSITPTIVSKDAYSLLHPRPSCRSRFSSYSRPLPRSVTSLDLPMSLIRFHPPPFRIDSRSRVASSSLRRFPIWAACSSELPLDCSFPENLPIVSPLSPADHTCSAESKVPDDHNSSKILRRHVVQQSLLSGALVASSAATLGPVGKAEAAADAEGLKGGSLPLVPPGKAISEGVVPSSIIKGCWQLAGGHRGERESDRTGGQAALADFQKFVEAGVTTFDTADIYGPSESLIGEYVRRHGREGLQLFTKHCVFSPDELRNPTKEIVARGISRSCSATGFSSLDLVQFYWHDYNQRNFVQTAQYLAEIQAEGKIRCLGVTNFDTPRVQAMLDGGVPIVASQVQYSLLDRRAENVHADFCLRNGISILPFGTVAGGFLTDKYVGMPYEEAQKTLRVDTYSKSKYLSVLSQVGGWSVLQNLLNTLRSIADKHQTSVANVSTRWVLQQPAVAAVIVGARNARHVDDHRRLFKFSLDDADLEAIAERLEGVGRPKGDIYTWERGGVF